MCCAIYHVVAQPNWESVANQEDIWIELKAPAGIQIAIQRINVYSYRATILDSPVRLRVARATTAGTGGSLSGALRYDPLALAPGTTITIKSGTNNFTPGTITDVLLDTAFNARMSYEWTARDYEDMLWSTEGGYLEVLLRINDTLQASGGLDVGFVE